MKHALRIALAALITSAPAMAHERWVDHELIRPFDRALFDPTNGTTLAVWGGALAVLALAVLSGRRAPAIGLRAPSRLRGAGAGALRVALGVTLVLFALEGRFLAPDLVVSAGPVGSALLVAATGLGLLLALGIQTPRVAALLVLAFVAALGARPFEDFDGARVTVVDVLAYSGALGMAAYLGLRAAARHQPRPLCVVTYRSAAVSALRLALGLNLVLLGVVKFLHPELFVAVAQNYPSLFQDPFRPLGPEAVTLAASTVECGLGGLLIVGVWPRLVGLALLVAFGGTTLVLEGELVGHLPLIATALVLALEEPGRLTDLGRVLRSWALPKYRPVPERCETRGRLAFVPLALIVGSLAILVPTSTGSAGAPVPSTLRAGASWAEVEGESGVYRYELDVDEAGFRLQEFFAIRTSVRDARSGRPLDGFELAVDLTMPHHGHGMLSAPRTAREGRGLFMTSGCKLHMPGAWQVSLELRHDGALVDRAALPLVVIRAQDAWTPDEYALISTLSPVPPPPTSPSNAHADEAEAGALGRALFHDARLSADGSVACATCHDPARAFTDGRATAVGLGTGERNTPSVLGAAHGSFFGWDGRRDSLWSQALGPIEAPTEMGAHRFDVARFVLAEYEREYAAVFGSVPELPARDAALEVEDDWARLSAGERERVTRVFTNVGKAVEAFERTLSPSVAPFDRYVAALAHGEHDGGGHLSPAARRGLDAFLGSAGCVHCHNGPLFTDQAFHRLDLPGDDDPGRARGLASLLDDPFRSDGRFSDGVTPDLEYLERAPADATRAFKTPSLRNVTRTAPYGHAGQLATLEAMLEHYRTMPTRPAQAAIDPILREIEPTFDVGDMVAFLESLSAD